MKEGADLYVKQLNAELKNSGSDKQFEIIWLDNQADDTEAQNAYYKLVDEYKAVAILGDVLSGNCMAVAELAAEDGIPMVTASSTRYEVTSDRPNVFRTCFLDPFQGVVMANYANSVGLKKVAVLYGNDDDYSIGLKDSFVAQCNLIGIEIVCEVGAGFRDNDFSSQLTTIAATDAEALFVPFYGAQASQILPQSVQAGLDVVYLGSDGIADIVSFISNKALLTKMFYCDHFAANADTEIVKNFISSFAAEYGKNPDLSFSATGYDAALVICQAILDTDSTDYATVVSAIKNTPREGVSGSITFDDHNDPIKSAFIMTFDAEANKLFVTQLNP